MKWTVIFLTLLISACNSQQSKLSSISGINNTTSSSAPFITSVTPPANALYTIGQTLNFSFKFSKAVEVQGTPRLAIQSEIAVRYADYISGSGTDTLQFAYTITDGISDDNGITLSLAIDLNGGSIFDPIENENARLTYTTPATWGILINASTASLVSITPPANGTYSTGQTLRFLANFSERVCGTNTPRLAINIGGNPRYATRVAEGCATTMKFDYVIQPGDSDTDGIQLVNASIDLTVGPSAIKDSFNEAAILSYAAASYPLVLVTNVVVPPVEQPRTVPANGTLKIGDFLEATLNFNEAVFVTGGAPHITATIGSNTRNLTYLGGSGTSSLVFRYTIVEGDLDIDGISLGSLTYNGSSIKDSDNANAPITQSWPSMAGVLVDGVRPVISSITIPSNGIYRPGQTLNFVVTWSEHVNFTAPFPSLKLTFDSVVAQKSASSAANNGYSTTYAYTLQNGDADFNGIVIPSAALTSGGGTIVDDAGNAATVLSFAPQTTSGIKIAPYGVDHWYDPTNVGTFGSSTDPTLSEFKDLIGTSHGSVGAGIGWSGSPKRVDLAANDISFASSVIPTFQYMALVMTVKVSNPGQIVFASNPQLFLEINGGYTVGASCANCAQYYDGASWISTSIFTGNFGGVNPSVGQKKIILIKYPTTTNVDLYLNAFNGWYLNEMILLSGASVQTYSAEFWRALLMKHSSSASP